MKKFLLPLLAGAVILAAPVAKADQFVMTNYTVLGAVNVDLGPPISRSVQAGEIELTGPGGNLLVWCLDLTDTLLAPYTYNINSFTAGDVRPGLGQLSLLDGNALRQIASLMLNGAGFDPDGLSDAATQLAIWKIEYGNLFDPTNLSAQLTTDMNAHIAASIIGGILDCPGCTFNVLTDAPNVPNQALGFAVQAVPGPIVGAGLPGLLAAFAGLFALNRRRRQNSGSHLPV
jgi:hypothetical protein